MTALLLVLTYAIAYSQGLLVSNGNSLIAVLLAVPLLGVAWFAAEADHLISEARKGGRR